MAIEKDFNKEIIETEDWNDDDYDNFLDYLEDLDDDYDDDETINDYEDYEDDYCTAIQPMQRSTRNFSPTVQQQQYNTVQYDGNNEIGGFFNTLASNGINIGISDNYGSGFVIGGNGIGININPNTLINMSNTINNGITQAKYNNMQRKIKKDKERRKIEKLKKKFDF